MMSKNNLYVQSSPTIYCLLLLMLMSCTSQPSPTVLPQITHTPIISATATPEPSATLPTFTPYYSAPRDEAIDTACRITINLFFRYKQGDDLQAYRDLFTPDAQYRADSIKPPPDARIILELMPASEQWLRDFPQTPMPGTIFPEKQYDFAYYVKFTAIDHEKSGVNVTYFPPSSINMMMAVNGPNSCKIANYGHG